jgi:hypothetical protein
MQPWAKLLIYLEIGSENTKDKLLFQQAKVMLVMDEFHTNLFHSKKNEKTSKKN